MVKSYKINWVFDLKKYVKVFNTFIFEGGVHDFYPILNNEKEQFEYYSLEYAIAHLLSEKYCVVFFDHEKQAGKVISDGSGTTTLEQEDNPTKVDEDNVFNSFTFFEKNVVVDGKTVPNPNIELFKEYYKDKYINNISSRDTKKSLHDVSLDSKRIRDAMLEFDERKKNESKYKDCKPFIFIMKNVSRIMTYPGSPNEAENFVLMQLFEATQLFGISSKLFLFVDKMNDLPTWFEAENTNSSIKKIFLPLPNAEYRDAFFNNELINEMELSTIDKEKQITKFIGNTEGFSTRRLLQLKDFIISDKTEEQPSGYSLLSNIEKTVMAFNVGRRDNPWSTQKIKENIDKLDVTILDSVKGQDHIISKIQKQLKAAVTGVAKTSANDRRPRAIFFLAGPTGTGKTELTKTLAKEIFGSEDSIIRFDMSEFREESSDSRLFGAPPGYVGYEAGGQLTKAVKNNPFSIILFDEIEKASPKIWDKFLQILGDGRLTDGKGETVYFTQSVIIFTSNLGITPETNAMILSQDSDLETYEAIDEKLDKVQDEEARKELLDDLFRAVCFKCKVKGINVATSKMPFFEKYFKEFGFGNSYDFFCNFIEKYVLKRIKDYFEIALGRKEVLGRIGEDNILVYHFIDSKIAIQIADKKIKSYCNFLKDEHEKHLDLTITDEAIEFIHERIMVPSVRDLGGRGIVGEVETLLSEPIANFMYIENDSNIKAEIVLIGKELGVRKI